MINVAEPGMRELIGKRCALLAVLGVSVRIQELGDAAALGLHQPQPGPAENLCERFAAEARLFPKDASDFSPRSAIANSVGGGVRQRAPREHLVAALPRCQRREAPLVE